MPAVGAAALGRHRDEFREECEFNLFGASRRFFAGGLVELIRRLRDAGGWLCARRWPYSSACTR